MNFLNACTKNKIAIDRFSSFVKEVVDDGAQTFSRLSPGDKQEIVAYLINALDDKFEWFVESKRADATMVKFLNMLVSYDSFTKQDFIDAIIEQAIDYFSEFLDQYIADLAEKRQQEQDEEYHNRYPFLLDPEYQNGTDYKR